MTGIFFDCLHLLVLCNSKSSEELIKLLENGSLLGDVAKKVLQFRGYTAEELAKYPSKYPPFVFPIGYIINKSNEEDKQKEIEAREERERQAKQEDERQRQKEAENHKA